MINARAETVAKTNSYRGPIRKTRAIIPVDGWYEWRKEGAVRQPFHFRLEGGPAALAGLWTWTPKLEILSCSIIVTAANSAASEIHDRMPAVANGRTSFLG